MKVNAAFETADNEVKDIVDSFFNGLIKLEKARVENTKEVLTFVADTYIPKVVDQCCIAFKKGATTGMEVDAIVNPPEPKEEAE